MAPPATAPTTPPVTAPPTVPRANPPTTAPVPAPIRAPDLNCDRSPSWSSPRAAAHRSKRPRVWSLSLSIRKSLQRADHQDGWTTANCFTPAGRIGGDLLQNRRRSLKNDSDKSAAIRHLSWLNMSRRKGIGANGDGFLCAATLVAGLVQRHGRPSALTPDWVGTR